MKIIDMYGNEQDLAWLSKNYGQVEWTNTTRYELIELYETDGITTQLVNVRRKDGTPKPGVKVIFGWADGTNKDYTDQYGNVAFGMGEGAYYELPKQGPHWLTLLLGASIKGLGWKWGSNHAHLNAIYQEVGDGLPPPPLPTDIKELLVEVLGRLDVIIDILEG